METKNKNAKLSILYKLVSFITPTSLVNLGNVESINGESGDLVGHHAPGARVSIKNGFFS